MKKSRRFIRQTILLAFAFLFAAAPLSMIRAAGELDQAFNPATVNVRTSNFVQNGVNRIVVLPDGKVLIAGLFDTVGKNLKSDIARLNADGTLDPTFNPPTFSSIIYAVRVQNDGKIVVGGDFLTVNGQSRPGLARLNADGSLDSSFNLLNSPGAGFSGTVQDLRVSDDNRITFVGTFTYTAFGAQKNIGRVFADGQRDASFTAPAITANYFNRLELLSTGKILITGNSANAVNRLNSDGSIDSTFSPIALSGPSVIRVLPDGKFLIGGSFTTVNGFPLKGLARFNPDGQIDTSFNLSGESNGTIADIEITADGMLLIGGDFTTYNGNSRPKIALLDSNGNLTNSIVNTETSFLLTDLAILPNGKILIGSSISRSTLSPALVRLNSDGSLDNSFKLLIGNPGIVNKVFVQTDGKTLIGGTFTHTDGTLRFYISRLNADGTLDTTFTPAFSEYAVSNIDVRADGMILISTAQQSRRLNPDGTNNLTFANSGTDVKFVPGGGMLIALYNNSLRKHLESGALSYNVNADGLIRNIIIQPDGKIIVTGDFTQIAGVTRFRIARLNADGTLDATFNPPGGASNSIFASALQPDGKVIIGGNFPGINFNTDYKYLARLNSDGTLDTSFHPIVEGGVQSLKIQPNGKILVGGSMSSVNGLASRIVRLNTDGSLDPTFNPGVGPNNAVLTIDTEANGSVIIGGSFTRVGNFDRLGVARLISVNPAKTGFDFDGDGRADVSVFRPSNGAWYVQQSTNGFTGTQFGLSTDKLVPADYDGDGKTDVAVVRNGNWYIQRSSLGFSGTQFGDSNDVPVPADYDSDGRADIAVFRPSNGTWYLLQSTGGFSAIALGLGTDKPVPADYNGDGKAEVAVFRPSNGYWYLSTNPATGYGGVQFGSAEDKPVPADYDGDGKTDLAVFRPSNGSWYLLQSTAGFTGLAFGFGTDIPVPADYDGDGKADIAVFRSGNWYLNRTNSGFTGIQFGLGDDKPIPNSFVR